VGVVYKAAARHLLRRKRPGLVVRLKPERRTRARQRAFWFPVIRHHLDANISVADKYGRKFPLWLEREVDRMTPARWLHAWDEATGRRIRTGAGMRSDLKVF
jgi:hypothetical protein